MANKDPGPARDLEAARDFDISSACMHEPKASERCHGLESSQSADSELAREAHLLSGILFGVPQHDELQPSLCRGSSAQGSSDVPHGEHLLEDAQPLLEGRATPEHARIVPPLKLLHCEDSQPSHESRCSSALPVVCQEPNAADLRPVPLGRATSAPARSSSKVYPEDFVEREERVVEQPTFRAVIADASRLSQVVPTAPCTICLERFPASELTRLSRCHQAEHGTCSACLALYLKLRIDEGRVCDLKCPCIGDEGCAAEATERDLESFLDPATVEKYRRFVRLRGDSKTRQCPRCDEFCRAELRTPGNENGGVIAEMRCPSCGLDFCYYHSNAHQIGREACAAYERDILKKERATLATFGSKKCPGCGIITDKTSGCNHMTCSKCSMEWCWLCGKKITNLNWHYSPLRLGTCQQFADRGAQRDHFRIHFLLYVNKLLTYLAALVVILFYFLWFLIFLVSVAICGCPGFCTILCAKMCKKRPESVIAGATIVLLLTGLFLAGVPFLAFCLIWTILMPPVWFLLLPCGADREQLQLMVLIPLEVSATLPDSINALWRRPAANGAAP